MLGHCDILGGRAGHGQGAWYGEPAAGLTSRLQCPADGNTSTLGITYASEVRQRRDETSAAMRFDKQRLTHHTTGRTA